MALHAPANRLFRPHLALRWIAVLLLSILLHALLIGWANGNLRMLSAKQSAPAPIIAQLQVIPPAAPAPEPAAPVQPPRPEIQAKPKPKPKAKPRPRTRPTPPKPPAPQVVPQVVPPLADAPQATPEAPASPSLTPAEEPVAAPVDDRALSVDNAPDAEPPPAPAEASERHSPVYPAYRAALPASVELKYDVQALRDEKIVYGSGKLTWHYDGESYAVDGQASILFFTLLSFKSSGTIDEYGIAPLIYSEKRFRKAQTNTHFNRVSNTISFSASTASYPRQGGEQDRASIVWQLTSIGRADGERFVPGMALDFFVAGVRDAEPWRINVVGLEQTGIDGEQVKAWHLARVPRPGSYEQALDIWLDPQREWYPVKLRFTETNGEYLEMLLTGAEPASGQ
jgi:hypothetical protein